MMTDVLDLGHDCPGCGAGDFDEASPVHRGELGDDCDGILGKTRVLFSDTDVSRSGFEGQIGGKWHYKDRAYAAAVEGVILDDQHGAAESWFAAEGQAKIGPPDLTTCHVESTP